MKQFKYVKINYLYIIVILLRRNYLNAKTKEINNTFTLISKDNLFFKLYINTLLYNKSAKL